MAKWGLAGSCFAHLAWPASHAWASTAIAHHWPISHSSSNKIACVCSRGGRVECARPLKSLGSDLAQHHFCCFLLAKASYKASLVTHSRGWRNRLLYLMGRAAEAHCKGCGCREGKNSDRFWNHPHCYSGGRNRWEHTVRASMVSGAHTLNTC